MMVPARNSSFSNQFANKNDHANSNESRWEPDYFANAGSLLLFPTAYLLYQVIVLRSFPAR